ncbi:CATRA conflict system CASPASE/TPR repeat-associated protein [Micromonospora sp. NPDC049275]|uniref:CATRA conflict system CASPASE/TPR repeat-associated protein n=1 Tax=Micromonospora sp. NPDC049275 TaxID=3364268 RepID=UPI0037176123
MTPRKPALIVHTFFVPERAESSSGPTAADPATDAMRALWAGLAHLGMGEPIASYPTDLPEIRHSDPTGLRVLAARRRAAPGALYEALAYQRHDVVGVSVLLAPNDDGVGWQALSDQWTSNVPPTCGAELGTATIYLGLSDQRRISRFTGRVANPATWARRLRRQVPEAPDESTWATSCCRIADRLLLWELPPIEGYGQRRQLVLADLTDEPASDRLTWLVDGQVLPPLTRYLLCVAELRHQERVFEAALPELRGAVRRAERACEALADLVREADPSKRLLRAATLDLARVQAERGGLVTASADAGKMVETVRGIRTNMEAVLGRDLRYRSGGPLDRDRDRAVWLVEQLHTELAYVDSTWRKADQLGRLATAIIDERQRHRQEGLTLVQASIVGCFLMTLAAIQSFQYEVPLTGPLVPPLVCVLGILALVLPAAVLRWPRSGVPAPRPHWIAVGGLALGAALGWLGSSIGWWQMRGVPAPETWSVLSAAAGAAVLTLAALAVFRFRRP